MLTSRQDTAHSTQSNLGSDRRILLFDLSVGGHHPGYIQHLIRYWGEQRLPGALDILVVQKFIQQHGEVVEAAQVYGQNRVNFITLTPEEEASLGDRSTLLKRRRRSWMEWQILAQYTHRLKSTDCLLMYFDTCQLPIFARQPLACPFSGIYFRPTFHYHHFTKNFLSQKDKWQQRWETFYLTQVLRHPQLTNLFCLDPFVLDHIQSFNDGTNFVHLPDPVQIYGQLDQSADQLKVHLGIDPSRQVFLLFGALDGRKGIQQLLEAVDQMPANLAHKLCLLLVGPISASIKEQVCSYINQLRLKLPVQIIAHDQFITDHEIEPFFQMTDVVLAPYQRHVGMSGILVRAACAQKPVLCSDYGLMGEITRRYQLGITVDSTQPQEIAKGLSHFLLGSTVSKTWDTSQMQCFAEQNTAEQFAQTIFHQLFQTFNLSK